MLSWFISNIVNVKTDKNIISVKLDNNSNCPYLLPSVGGFVYEGRQGMAYGAVRIYNWPLNLGIIKIMHQPYCLWLPACPHSL